MPRLRAPLVVALAALFAPALFAMDAQNPSPASSAVPGTLNYIEGAAQIDGQFLSNHAAGSVTLQPGQEIATTTGRAEVLLTPGVFFRLGNNSAAKMVSPDLTNTVVSLERGSAEVEVDQLFKANDIHVLVNQVPVQLLKPGLYEFNASSNRVMVFKGEAAALRPNEKFVTVKEGHELNVSEAAAMQPARFDEAAQEQTPLYRWSSLRSDYLAEANQQIAGEYGAGYAPGWYWDPWMYDYTFLGPYPFYSPFGWGFYPLGWGWGGGFYGGGFYGRGFHGGGGFGGGGFHGGGGFGGGGHGR